MDRKAKPAWRRLGRTLRAERIKRGMTQAQVGRSMGVVSSHVSAWENGTRGITSEQAAQLDEVIGTSGVILRACLKNQASEVMPEWYEEVPGLERKATELREYQTVVFPGLLQTEGYTRALLRDTGPWVSPKDLEERAASRRRRQELLDKEVPALLLVVVEATVLERPIGGWRVLHDQLAHTIDLIERDLVRFQVMPPAKECFGFTGASGPFRIYLFPDKPAVDSAEYMEGEQLMDDSLNVQHCMTLFGILQSEALSPRASMEYLRKAKDEINDH